MQYQSSPSSILGQAGNRFSLSVHSLPQGPRVNSLSFLPNSAANGGGVCKVTTQDTENLDEDRG